MNATMNTKSQKQMERELNIATKKRIAEEKKLAKAELAYNKWVIRNAERDLERAYRQRVNEEKKLVKAELAHLRSLSKKIDRMLNKRTTKAGNKMPKIFDDSNIQFNGYPMICSANQYVSVLVEGEKDSFDEFGLYVEKLVSSLHDITIDKDMQAVFGNGYKQQQRQKLQAKNKKRNDMINNKIKLLKDDGIDADNIGGQIVVTKKYKLNKSNVPDAEFNP